jgi:hypothetical protein
MSLPYAQLNITKSIRLTADVVQVQFLPEHRGNVNQILLHLNINNVSSTSFDISTEYANSVRIINNYLTIFCNTEISLRVRYSCEFGQRAKINFKSGLI